MRGAHLIADELSFTFLPVWTFSLIVSVTGAKMTQERADVTVTDKKSEAMRASLKLHAFLTFRSNLIILLVRSVTGAMMTADERGAAKHTRASFVSSRHTAARGGALRS